MAEPITNVLGIVAIKNRGAYNNEYVYEKLNVVRYQGATYCAKTTTQGHAPTDTNFWDLMVERGEKGDSPVKGVDYYTAADKLEIEEDLADDIYDAINESIGGLASATPLIASTTAGMTDTTRIYVLETDGHWYWYDGTEWQDGGTYQATEIPKKSVSPEKTTFIKSSTNLFNKKDIIRGKYLSAQNGSLLDNASYFTSNYIPVEPNKTYYYNQSNRLVQYDDNKEFISGTQTATNFTTSNSTGYIRVSGLIKNLDAVQINAGSTELPYEDFKLDLDSNIKVDTSSIIESKLLEKRIVFLGDSYSYPNIAYHYKLSQKYGFTNLNYGVPSSRMSIDVTINDSTIKSFITRFDELKQQLGDNIDGIVILGGINDANSIRLNDLLLGTINDTAGTLTFYGKMKQLCEDIIEQYPTKRIMGIIPNNVQIYTEGMQAWYNALKNVQNAEREVYNLYGIPYADLQNDCFEMGITSNVVSTYRQATDNIHPNDAGQQAIANCIDSKFFDIFSHNN